MLNKEETTMSVEIANKVQLKTLYAINKKRDWSFVIEDGKITAVVKEGGNDNE